MGCTPSQQAHASPTTTIAVTSTLTLEEQQLADMQRRTWCDRVDYNRRPTRTLQRNLRPASSTPMLCEDVSDLVLMTSHVTPQPGLSEEPHSFHNRSGRTASKSVDRLQEASILSTDLLPSMGDPVLGQHAAADGSAQLSPLAWSSAPPVGGAASSSPSSAIGSGGGGLAASGGGGLKGQAFLDSSSPPGSASKSAVTAAAQPRPSADGSVITDNIHEPRKDQQFFVLRATGDDFSAKQRHHLITAEETQLRPESVS